MRVMLWQGPGTLDALIVMWDISPTCLVSLSAIYALLVAMLTKLVESNVISVGLGKCLDELPEMSDSNSF